MTKKESYENFKRWIKKDLMTSQPSLFYQGKYKQLLEEIEKIQDPSMQEIHNLAIVRFLATGQNPLTSLESIADQIRSESPNEPWPNHPSWNLLIYHISLYYFSTGNYSECSKYLKDLWDNASNADLLIVLCISLLSIELFIRTGDSSNVDKALSFLQLHFTNEEATTSFLTAKINDEKFVQKISQSVQFAKLRADVAKAIHISPSEAKQLYEKTLNSVVISPDVKNRTLLPVKKVIPIAFSALFLDDKAKYNTVLDNCNEQNHFAILSNKGIYELIQNRYSSALLHFSKALDARHNNSVVYPFHQIIYNIGLSLLKRNKARKAFKFFHSIIALMPTSPYLWLRLSECCVLFYKQRVAKLRQRTQQTPVIARTLCTANRKFYILPQTDYKLYSKYPLIQPNEELNDQNRYLIDLNLDFAEKCSRNAIALCPPDDKNLQGVKQAAELICSYVSLELGDGKRAVDKGKVVYSSPNADIQTQFLAKIYSAQGNAMIGEVSEARGILSRLMIESNKVREKDALAVHSATFALVYIASQNMRKAQDQVKKAIESAATSPEVVLTKVACELKNKKPQSAISALTQYGNGPSNNSI